jgi:hypothetical protein
VTDRVTYIGGSNTLGGLAAGSWRLLINEWLTLRTCSEKSTVATGGTDSWFALVNLATTVGYNPTHVFVEYAINDAAYYSGDQTSSARANGWWPAAEALIRRLRVEAPTARLVFVNLGTQYGCDLGTVYAEARDTWHALCTHYDLEEHQISRWLEDVIGTTPSTAECNIYYDGAHFKLAGHAEIYAMLEPHFESWFPSSGSGWSGTLPAPLYADVADWIHPPTLRTGIDNDGETGAGWATAGTVRSSSTAGDTISWTGTFCSFAVDIVTTSAVSLAWQVDGGDYTTVSVSVGVAAIRRLHCLDRDAHTVTVKVVSGTLQINRFLAL